MAVGPPGAPASDGWVEAIARWAVPVLAVAAVVNLVETVGILRDRQVLSNDMSREIAATTFGLTAFAVWMTRADAAARVRAKLPAPAMPPALWFLVPIANVWKPYQAVRQIWNTSGDHQPQADRSAWRIHAAWWAATLATAALFGASEGVRFTEFAALVVPLRAAGHVMAAVMLGLAIPVVRGIDRAQGPR